jgi:hypothetical protein
MKRHAFLTALHRVVAPRNYLEIGVGYGRGLACSSVRTIGVDPAPKINVEISCEHRISMTTSDDFFANSDAISWFDQDTVDLTLIDGMHLSEFALRDFINTERLSSASSVAVFDDMLPRTVTEAARDRISVQWAGDVYKVAGVLERYRPDLTVVPVNTGPTGMLLVVGLDPGNRVLCEHYEEIVDELVRPDPQDVPTETLLRLRAAAPRRVLAASIWSDLAVARTTGEAPPENLRSRLDLLGTARYVPDPPASKPWPTGSHRPDVRFVNS